MTRTFEELYLTIRDGQADNTAYDKARAAKVAEVADSIRADLKSPAAAEAIAEQIVETAESFGRVSGNTISGEVAGSYTIRGNPIPLTV